MAVKRVDRFMTVNWPNSISLSLNLLKHFLMSLDYVFVLILQLINIISKHASHNNSFLSNIHHISNHVLIIH